MLTMLHETTSYAIITMMVFVCWMKWSKWLFPPFQLTNISSFKLFLYCSISTEVRFRVSPFKGLKLPHNVSKVKICISGFASGLLTPTDGESVPEFARWLVPRESWVLYRNNEGVLAGLLGLGWLMILHVGKNVLALSEDSGDG